MLTRDGHAAARWLWVIGAMALAAPGLRAAQPPEKVEEKRAPEHNVTLEEDEAVNMLLKRARDAAAKAAQEPESWPVCVKAYSEILAKHTDKVYLYRWAGDDQADAGGYGLGVYRSVAEKVAEELAALPPAGLAVYRAVNDPPARGLFLEAQEKLDERQLNTIARTYFSTSWGDDALFWLAAIACDRGAHRQALVHLGQLAKHPDAGVPQAAVLSQTLLCQVKAGRRAEAQQTLERLSAAIKDQKPGVLRIGHLEGEAALSDLRARLEAAPKPAPAPAADSDWETLMGNAAHNKPAPPRSKVGVRKWSFPISRLLGAPANYQDRAAVTVREMHSGQMKRVTRINTHLALRGPWFFLCNSRLVACHPMTNPNPERPQYWYPSPAGMWGGGAQPGREQIYSVVDAPLFCTLGENHLYAALGPEPLNRLPRGWGGGQEQKQPPNWIVAIGRKKGGTLGIESGSLLWSLEPGSDPDFRVNTQADQKWLSEIYFASSPTYSDGTLYAMAVDDAGSSRTAYVLSLDAPTGRLLWKTKVCAGSPPFLGGGLQPALGLPVAVGGGAVYCVTNLGAVAALEAATGAVKWIRIYERAPGLEVDPRMGRGAGVSDFWAANAPLLAEDVLVVTPQDSGFMYGLDPQTGRRKWQADRAREPAPGSGETDRLRWVLGVVKGHLIVSGKKSVFSFGVQGGRAEANTTAVETSIVGRGVVAGEMIFYPSARKIHSASCKETAARSGLAVPSMALKDECAYAEPEAEAGNLFVSGQVLFSVSATHVNAYFIPDVIEGQLKARLEASPDDLSAWAELGEVYHVQDRFDEAVATYEKGLARPAARSNDPHAQAQAADLRGRRFEAFFAAGEKQMGSDPVKAQQRYEQALNAAQTPEHRVRALWKLAEAALARKDEAAAADLFQRMLSELGDVSYTFDPNTTCLASVYAQRRIEGIKRTNPKALEQLEARAGKEIAAAAAKKDAGELEAALRNYPHTDAYAQGLLTLTRLAVENNDPAKARTYGQRYMALRRSSLAPAEALACLAWAYERCGLLGAAKDLLRRISAAPALADTVLEIPGLTSGKAGAWAGRRLSDPMYQRPVTNAARGLGDGRLVETWSRPALNVTAALVPAGQPPASMARNIILIEQGSELSVRNGQTGEELWIPRPRTPVAARPDVCAWCDELLILGGPQAVTAYDARHNGKVAWTYNVGRPSEEAEEISPEQTLGMQYGGVGSLTFAAAENLLALGLPTGQLVVLDATCGQTLWTAKTERPPFFGRPLLEGGLVAAASQSRPPATVSVFDLATGQKRFEIRPPGNQFRTTPELAAGRLYIASADERLRAYSMTDGKQAWEFPLTSPAVALNAGSELVLCVLSDLEVVALDPNAADESRRLLWRARPDSAGQFAGLAADGEDVFLATRQEPKRGQVWAFQARGGKLKWRADTAGEAIEPDRCLAKEHLLIGQAGFEARARGLPSASLVHRASGKLTWTRDFPPGRLAAALMFEGGLVLAEAGKLTGFQAGGPEGVVQDPDALQKQLLQASSDGRLRVRLAQMLYDRREGAKALETLLPALADPKTDADLFAQAFDKFSRFRGTLSRTTKPTLTFIRLNSAPGVDGDLADWANVPAVTLDAWRDVYLAAEDPSLLAYRREAWSGPQDLSVTFRGGYDDKNLYLAFAATDDVHLNPQTEGVELWNGDSVQVAFDLEQDTRMGYFGNDFELGLALNGRGQLLAWRWVEKGKYVMKALEAPARVVRDEARKLTSYELALPLDYLGLKAEAGLKFGFTFIVNDADKQPYAEKGIGPSPGIWNPKFPGQYATGQLGGGLR